MSVFWVILAGVAVLVLLSGGNRNAGRKPGGHARIDHPHVIDPDDYECPVCRGRFRQNTMVCPHCGTRFTGRVEDDDEFILEEDELEDWDEEDGM